MFEKTLILCPARISLNRIFTSVLANLSDEVKTYDVSSEIGRRRLTVNTRMRRFPYGIRNRWDSYFFRLANELIINEISIQRPDLVLVYNSEFLLPETCIKIRKTAKLVFFLGDSPFYTPQNDYYIACLNHADLVLVPDSFWMSQLNTMGIDRTIYFIPGIDETEYHRLEADEAAKEEGTDILYAGTSYKNSWGYRKAALMSRFSEFNTRIYGNDAWERWFPFFPELKPLFRRSGYIPSERLNRMFNRTKIIPVDGNPSIINGAHLRLLEALAAGALPLIEYRRDVNDEIFSGSGITLPVIKNYNEASSTASYWLEHEEERLKTVVAMSSFFKEKYNAEKNAVRIREGLGI